MRKYTTCRSCNRTIASDFRYCPHCGRQRIRPYEFRHLLDQSFTSMDPAAQVYSLRRLRRLEEQLVVMETDLDSFLSTS